MSRSVVHTFRLTNRCFRTRLREIICFICGAFLTGCLTLLLYPALTVDCSELICEVATTLPTDSLSSTSSSGISAQISSPFVSLHQATAMAGPSHNTSSFPTIYIITPTHKRLTQKADLVRLCQTLRLIENIVWILVEDSADYTPLVKDILKDCPVQSVHLNKLTTSFVARSKGGGGHRGVDQRNKALVWIRDNVDHSKNGVVYFGDDDNAYDIRLFEEMRYTNVVSVWPVAFVGMLKYESPICSNGRVTGWHVSFRPDRKFPVDMAAFAVGLSLIMAKSDTYINPSSSAGMLENDFLTELGVAVDQLEAKADNCKKIYVWHVKTEKPKFPYEKKNPGDIDIIV